MCVPEMCLPKCDHISLKEQFSKAILSFYASWGWVFLTANPYSGINTFPIITSLLFFLKNIFHLFTFRERGREGKREGGKHQCVRDTLVGSLSHTPNWGAGPQPGHEPWVGTGDLSVWRLVLNPLSHTSQDNEWNPSPGQASPTD